jgi:hypothetical protein
MPIQLNVPNINTGKPWSPMDDEDLEGWFVKGKPIRHKEIARVAEFLCRNQVEVRTRLRELGYIRPQRSRRTGAK